MAPLSPGIPTSFVPRQPVQQAKRPISTGNNVFLLAAIFIGILALVATAGTFVYDKYLQRQLESRAAELAVAQQSVNQDQVEEFIRLRDRLSYGQNLLNSHTALSQVFDLLEAETLVNVRYRDMRLVVANDQTAQLETNGSARNFNALAAQSNAFAGDKNIKRAIFSGITVEKDGSVNFKLTAELDSRLVISQKTVAPATVAPAAATPAPTLPAAASSTATTTVPAAGTTTAPQPAAPPAAPITL